MWPVHRAKARLSEVLACAEREGPQIITRRGRECSVVLAIEDYRKLVRGQPNLRDYLLGGPKLDAFEIERDRSPGREIEL